jgi:hypothetical protein
MSSLTPAKYVPPHKRGLPTPPLTPPSSRSSSPASSCSPSPPPTRGLMGSWRATAAPPSSSNKSLPSFDNVELGMVFYLPAEEKLTGSRIHEQLHGSDQSPWCHPAVIVGKRKAADGEECVEVRLCTTLRGTHVEVKKQFHQQGFFMLADNTEDNTPHGSTILARMTGSSRFGKRTYINLSFNSKYTVEYRHLTPYNGNPPMQFDADALEKIQSGRPYSD